MAPTHALTGSSNICLLGLFRLHLTETHWQLLEQKGGLCDHGTVGASREAQGLRVSAYFFPDCSPPLHVAWSSPLSRLTLTVTSSQMPVFILFPLAVAVMGREGTWRGSHPIGALLSLTASPAASVCSLLDPGRRPRDQKERSAIPVPRGPTTQRRCQTDLPEVRR